MQAGIRLIRTSVFLTSPLPYFFALYCCAYVGQYVVTHKIDKIKSFTKFFYDNNNFKTGDTDVQEILTLSGLKEQDINEIKNLIEKSLKLLKQYLQPKIFLQNAAFLGKQTNNLFDKAPQPKSEEALSTENKKILAKLKGIMTASREVLKGVVPNKFGIFPEFLLKLKIFNDSDEKVKGDINRMLEKFLGEEISSIKIGEDAIEVAYSRRWKLVYPENIKYIKNGEFLDADI